MKRRSNLHTIRVSDSIYHAMLTQKRGNDTANDVITRWYLGSTLLHKATTKDLRSVESLQKLALSPGGVSCPK